MKKLFIIVLSLVIFGALSTNSVYAYETPYTKSKMVNLEKNLEFRITDKKHYYYQGSSIVVFGNYDRLSKKEVNQ
ncbi:MAG: hypothetical protein GX312_02305 [Candidatus Phytoplasma sp.]|nr:hypothetical protein [Phytoplasma sp.]